MFVEPPATAYDLHFRLFGVPVRVHPMFWLVSVLLGASGGGVKELLSWVIVVFISILVHEFGHVLAYVLYGMRGKIVLYAFGGLAIRDAYDSPWRSGASTRNTDGWPQVVISLAGPAAGFALAGLVISLLYATNTRCSFLFNLEFGQGEHLYSINPQLHDFVFDMLYVNILWGLVNLLPIYPLDGGQVARELFLMANVRDGIRMSLVLSIVTAGGIAAWIIVSHKEPRDILNAMLFAYLAYNNYQYLLAYTGRGGWGSGRW